MDTATLIDRMRTGVGMIGARLPQVLEDPRAYPRETMILALIGAVLLVVIALLAVWLHGWLADRAVRAQLKLRRQRRATALRWLLAAGALLAIAALGSMAPMWAPTSAACGACHAVRAGVDSWRADAHASVGCYGCHAQRGMLGAWEAGARGLTALLGEAARPPAQDSGCLRCHEKVRDELVVTATVRVRHVDTIEAGMSCLQCHQDVGHERSAVSSESAADAGGVIERPVMSRCLHCHDGATADAECSVCHVGRKPSDASDAAAPRGDTPAPVTCEGCHKPATDRSCVECHGLVLPHPQAFRGQHAGASFGDPALCAKCHEKARASTADACACHDVTNVHGTYSRWFPVHGPAARTNGEGGCRCHTATFCGFCHAQDPWR